MSRKIRAPKSRTDMPLTPAWLFTLMTGQFAPGRVRGWVAQANDVVKRPDGFDYTEAGDRLWESHGDTLTDEATRHGFAPYWTGKRQPRGPAFEAWAAAFLQEHRY